MSGFYVYMLRDEAGVPFYVGKGSGMRALSHAFRDDPAGGPEKQATLDRIAQANGKLGIEIVERFPTAEAALAREAGLIAELGTVHDGRGPLTNRLGGAMEGITGEQLQAARALLRWSQQELAEKAGVSVPTLKRLEGMRGRVKGMYETVLNVSGALTGAGIEFLNSDAPGVRLRPCP